MVLPLILILWLVMLVIFVIVLFLGIFWIMANPIPTMVIVVAMAFIAYLWKRPKGKKKAIRR